MNTEFRYFYRGSDNRKKQGRVVLPGAPPEGGWDLSQFAWEREYFLPSQVGWPVLSEEIGPWHEIEEVSATGDPPTPGYACTAEEQVEAFRRIGPRGWNPYKTVRS